MRGSGKDKVLAHRFHHFPGAGHAWLDNKDIAGAQVNGFQAIGGDDAVALAKYWLLFIY